MKGWITDWKKFLGEIEKLESIQIGEDIFVDKSQMKERCYEAYKKQEMIEIFY